jgi:hypothetical protein
MTQLSGSSTALQPTQHQLTAFHSAGGSAAGTVVSGSHGVVTAVQMTSECDSQLYYGHEPSEHSK